MSLADKRLRFALSACGVDPDTVTIASVIHDWSDITCNASDEDLVRCAIKIWIGGIHELRVTQAEAEALKLHLEQAYPAIKDWSDLLNKPK